MRLKNELLKRIFDIVISGSGFLILAPLMGGIVVLIRLTQGKQIFFRQIRPGKDGRAFHIVKFCTMTNNCNACGCPLPDAERLTRVGMFLRSTSLDELPELWNVLKGDMSIVGPRPLLMQYLQRYAPEQARRHEVRPGITGWAQINGRNAITWEEKFKLDIWYVDNRSLWLDINILAITIWKTLKREGINQPGQATMEEFRGSSNECR
jgi:sugar transferase EpsL